MRVRIRVGRGTKIERKPPRRSNLALALAALLTPAAAATAILGLWGIAADLKWTSDFAIHSGLFSHWQVWMLAALLLQLAAHYLQRTAEVGGANEESGDRIA